MVLSYYLPKVLHCHVSCVVLPALALPTVLLPDVVLPAVLLHDVVLPAVVLPTVLLPDVVLPAVVLPVSIRSLISALSAPYAVSAMSLYLLFQHLQYLLM